MARPKKWRLVSSEPIITLFSPQGNISKKEQIVLSVDGLEALKLSDVEGLEQEAAAKLMGISRQTYGRILAKARNIVAKAIVLGKSLKIHGGTYKVIE